MMQHMSHPVVLITGGDDFLVAREVRRLWQAMRAASPDLERVDVDGSDSEAAGNFIAATSPGLFGDLPLIVVDRVEESDEPMQRNVLDFVAAADPEVRALFIVRGGVRGRGFVEKIKSAGVNLVPLETPKGRGIDEFIALEFKHHKRKPPTQDAIKALRVSVGDDLASLAAAVSQLAVDVEKEPIDVESIERYYEGMAGVAPYQVTDAAFAGRVSEALANLRWTLERDPGIGPAVIATGLAGLRGLIAISNAPAGVPDADLAKSAGVPPWKVRILKEQARRWGNRQLADAMLLLVRADAALKGGEIDQHGQIQVLDAAQRQALLERTVVAVARLAGRQ